MEAFITKISRKRKCSELNEASKKPRKKEIACKSERQTIPADDDVIIEDYSDHASDELEIEDFSESEQVAASLSNHSNSLKTQETPSTSSKMGDTINTLSPPPKFNKDTRTRSCCETAYSQLLKRSSQAPHRRSCDGTDKVQGHIHKFFPTSKSRNIAPARSKTAESKKTDDDTRRNIHRGNEVYLRRRETTRVVSDFTKIETDGDAPFDLLVRCKESWATEELWIKACKDWRPNKRIVVADCNNRSRALVVWGEECFDIIPLRIFDVVLITNCSMKKSPTLRTSGHFYVIGNLLDNHFYDAISRMSWHDVPVTKPITFLQFACESAEHSVLEKPIDDYQELPQTVFDYRLKNVLCFVEEFSSSHEEHGCSSAVVLKTRDIQGNRRRLILHSSAGDWTKALRLHQKSLWEFKQMMPATSFDYEQEEMHTTLSSQADHCDQQLNYRHQLNNCTVIEDKTSLHDFVKNASERRAVVRVSTVESVYLLHNAVCFETRQFSLCSIANLIDVFLLLRSNCEDDHLDFYFVVHVDRVVRPVIIKASAEVFLSIWYNSSQHQSISKADKGKLVEKLKHFLTCPNTLVVEKKIGFLECCAASLSLLDVC